MCERESSRLRSGSTDDQQFKLAGEALPGILRLPRERFHLRDKSQYLWAGLQFRG